MRRLAAEFAKSNPNIKIEIPDNIGTGGGIKALTNGEITVAMASRDLKDEEKNLGFRTIPYAQTALVFGAHPSVSDNNITPADLVDIYKGNKTNWSDGKQITVLTREPGDSSILILEQKVPGFKEAYAESQKANKWKTLLSEQESLAAIENTPLSIGMADSGVIADKKSKIKKLNFNGVSPTFENVASGKYPFGKKLTLVLPKEQISAEAQQFVDFILSSAGQKIITDNGYYLLK